MPLKRNLQVVDRRIVVFVIRGDERNRIAIRVPGRYCKIVGRWLTGKYKCDAAWRRKTAARFEFSSLVVFEQRLRCKGPVTLERVTSVQEAAKKRNVAFAVGEVVPSGVAFGCSAANCCRNDASNS